jgi:hypothetical protein
VVSQCLDSVILSFLEYSYHWRCATIFTGILNLPQNAHSQNRIFTLLWPRISWDSLRRWLSCMSLGKHSQPSCISGKLNSSGTAVFGSNSHQVLHAFYRSLLQHSLVVSLKMLGVGVTNLLSLSNRRSKYWWTLRPMETDWQPL